LQTRGCIFGALFLGKLGESSGIQYQRAPTEIIEKPFKFLEKLTSAFSDHITEYGENHQESRRRGADDSGFIQVR
jgi:hypothetical protein